MPENFKALMLAGLLLAPMTAQAASMGNRVPAAGSTVLSDAEMDKAHGKDAPYELAAPVLLIPGVGEAALAGAAVLGAAFLVYKGGEAIYNAVTSNGSSSTVDTAKGDAQAQKNREESQAKGIPDSQIGPSGRPKLHNVDADNRKDAKEAAQQESAKGQQPMYHPNSSTGQPPHYHPTDSGGDKKLPNTHYNFPKK